MKIIADALPARCTPGMQTYSQTEQFSAWFSYAGRELWGAYILWGVVTPVRLYNVSCRLSSVAHGVITG
ncbi:MAG: hypothetical protein HW402_1148 [Dehalococcoidales bacterium]|nr:hypothetical protein [Dehalococcoidales bacterium]